MLRSCSDKVCFSGKDSITWIPTDPASYVGARILRFWAIIPHTQLRARLTFELRVTTPDQGLSQFRLFGRVSEDDISNNDTSGMYVVTTLPWML